MKMCSGNSIQEMEERISEIKDKIKQMDTYVKENVKAKKMQHKHLGHYERTKSKNKERKNPSQKY